MFSKETIFCDQLILGSGPGGSVVFEQLSKAGFSPLLIEEGVSVDDTSFQENPSMATFKNYRSGGISPVLSWPIFVHGEGKVLGGGSTINGGLMWRTPENIQAEWQEPLNNKGINQKEIYEFFDEIDNYMQIENQRSLKGFDLDSAKLFLACKHLNWRIVPARRAVQACKRYNQCGAGCPSGAKRTMIKSCLQVGLRNGGKIKTETRVEKLIVRQGRVVDVRCVDLSGKKRKAFSIVPSELFLSFGALETPKLLLRSNIVKTKNLRLGLHLNLRFLAKFSDEINANKATMFTYQVQEFLDKGIIIMASNLRKMYLSPILSKLDKKDGTDILNSFKFLGLYTTTLRPHSYGGFFKLPFLNAFPFFFTKQKDFDRLKFSARMTCKLLFSAGAEYIVMPFYKPKLVYSLDEAEACIENSSKNDFEFLSVHAMSSIPITHKNLITEEGKINGIENLYISDGSILPSTIGESPQQTIMAFSHYIVQKWIARRKNKKGL